MRAGHQSRTCYSWTAELCVELCAQAQHLQQHPTQDACIVQSTRLFRTPLTANDKEITKQCSVASQCSCWVEQRTVPRWT